MDFIRLISLGPGHAFFNMALDEAISDAVRRKLSPPTLRLYSWDGPSLSIGYFQKTSDVNAEYCSKRGYPLVRRLTGGRAILHDSELTYCFSVHRDSPLFRGSLLESYRTISQALLLALELIGIKAEASFERKRRRGQNSPACFKAVSYGEITSNGRKIIGSAQKRYKDGFLQHGSILLQVDVPELCRVLGQSDQETFKGIGAIKDVAAEIPTPTLERTVKEAFEKIMRVKLISDNPTKFELDRAHILETSKYSTREWNFLR